jgi:hypothetical protein
VTAYDAPGADDGIFWDDPDLGIGWGMAADEVLLSDKDVSARSKARSDRCGEAIRYRVSSGARWYTSSARTMSSSPR